MLDQIIANSHSAMDANSLSVVQGLGGRAEQEYHGEITSYSRGVQFLGTPVQDGLRVLNCSDFLDLDLPKRGHILHPIIPEQGLVMLYAPRGLGKTWVALSLSWASATAGDTIGGWYAETARKVLYIDGEMPAKALQERVGQIIKGAGGTCPQDDNFKILTPDIQPCGMPNFASTEGHRIMAPYVEDRDLIVLDNLATLCRGGRENETESWRPIQEWLLSMRRQGKSVLLVHHAGKGGQQRGASAREDILDTVIALKKPGDYAPEQGARFEVHIEKGRGLTGREAQSFSAHLELSDEGAKWSSSALEDERIAKVKDLLKLGLSVRDIAEETGIPKSTVQRLKSKIVAA